MPRPLRLEAEGAVYHVIARGNERKAVFRDDRDRQEYLDRLIRCRERFGLRVLAFCLMGNHLHLAVERGPTKLSRVMLALQCAVGVHAMVQPSARPRRSLVSRSVQGVPD